LALNAGIWCPIEESMKKSCGYLALREKITYFCNPKN